MVDTQNQTIPVYQDPAIQRNKRVYTFVHLSDLHFGQDELGGGALYSDIRKQVIADCKEVADFKQTKCDGILVTGDIAFSGKRAEYSDANDWLNKFARKLGPQCKGIFVVPGNHDVDRKSFTESDVSAFQRIRTAPTKSDIQKELKALIALPASLRYLEAYFEFATRICNSKFKADAKTYWQHPVMFRDEYSSTNYNLCLLGFNSVRVSDDFDGIGAMVLGRDQYFVGLEKEPNIEYAVLSHHPLDWFKDKEEVKRIFESRARILLFGHEHISELKKISFGHGHEQLVIHAGAATPPESEDISTYQYNIIQIHMESDANPKIAEKNLVVTVFPRRYSKSQDKFIANGDDVDLNANGSISFIVKCRKFTSPPPSRKAAEASALLKLNGDREDVRENCEKVTKDLRTMAEDDELDSFAAETGSTQLWIRAKRDSLDKLINGIKAGVFKSVAGYSILGAEFCTSADFARVGDGYFRLGNYPEAERFYLAALEEAQEPAAETTVQRLRLLNLLGRLYTATGDYDRADNYLQRALAMARPEGSTEVNELKVQTLNIIGLLQCILRNLHDAGNTFNEARQIATQLEITKHSSRTYEGLGMVAFLNGDMESAQAIWEEGFGRLDLSKEEDRLVAPFLRTKLGRLYYRVGRFNEAYEWLDKAVFEGINLYGEGHPALSILLNNYAEFLYQVRSQFDLALSLYGQSLQVREIGLGFGRRDCVYAYTLNDLGAIYFQLEQYDVARNYLREALEIKERLLGDYHPDTAFTALALGKVYLATDDPDRAIKLMQHALAIRKMVYTPSHPEVINAQIELANCFFQKGELDRCRELLAASLKLCSGLEGATTSERFRIYEAFGRIHMLLDEHSLAKQYFETANNVLEAGNFAFQHAHIESCFGECNQREESYEQAELHYKKALEIHKTIYDGDTIEQARIISCLASISSALERREEALSLYNQAHQIYSRILGNNHLRTSSLRESMLAFERSAENSISGSPA